MQCWRAFRKSRGIRDVVGKLSFYFGWSGKPQWEDMFAQTCRKELPWGSSWRKWPRLEEQHREWPAADSEKSRVTGSCGLEERRSQSGQEKWPWSWSALSALVRAFAYTLSDVGGPAKVHHTLCHISLLLVHLSYSPNPVWGLYLFLIHLPFETWVAEKSDSSLSTTGSVEHFRKVCRKLLEMAGSS